jgi:UDP:flavonoid glycosyltransferase YjiC (YdhE family)
MARVLLVATAGAGGDLQPLLAAAVALRDRHHDLSVVGDRSVVRAATDLEMKAEVLPPEFDLGPTLVAAVRDAMREADGDPIQAGPIVQGRMTEWAVALAPAVADAADAARPDVLLTSLFGVEVLGTVDPACPWVVVNSTFYIGPNPPRPLEADVSARAIPLLASYASLLDDPSLVLHATDQVFDFGFDRLPPGHHYVGPLGIWEPALGVPGYLDKPGPRWGLVTISSQLQDDLPLLETALEAGADKDLRIVATVGADRTPAMVASSPANARLEATLSHAAVLERASVLVSHAGHGSVMKALWHGVPMVLVPWGRDQPGVAARAEALGTAVVVERTAAGSETISAAIDTCLNDMQMQTEAGLHRDRLAETDPQGLAADHIESLLK